MLNQSEWKSKVISRLYALKAIDEYDTELNEDLPSLLEDIRDNNDSVFILPLFEAYQRLQGTTSSHYFVSALAEYPDQQATDCLLKIAISTDRDTDLRYVLQASFERKLIDQRITERALTLLNDSVRSEGLDEYDLHPVLAYFLMLFEVDVQNRPYVVLCAKDIWTNVLMRRSTRLVALIHHLKFDKISCLNSILLGFKTLDSDGQIIVAKELSKWSGTIVQKIKEIILAKGVSPAKRIIENEIQDKKKEEEQQKQKENERYLNMELVDSIRTKWNYINIKSTHLFGKPVLKEINGNFCMDNARAKNSKEEFLATCKDIRTLLESSLLEHVASEGVQEECYTDLDIKNDARNRPLARLSVYLKMKGINVDKDFFGLRGIVALCSKELHDVDMAEHFKLLRKNGLDKLFSQQNWSELHKTILVCLEEAFSAFLNELQNKTDLPMV